jgi:uncharacterized membrane protein YoaK (UPF0700 family)
LPGAISTAVMTGNLTNTVLSIMDTLSRGHPLMSGDDVRLKRSLYLLFGFLLGCVVAATAISTMGEWAWSLPVVLAAAAVVRRDALCCLPMTAEPSLPRLASGRGGIW